VSLLLVSAASACAQGVVAPVSPVPVAPSGALLSRDDGWFAAAAAVGVTASAFGDGWAWRESQGSQRPETRGLARFTQRLGDPRIVGPALLAGYVTGRITGLPNFSAASARVAGATLGAAVLCDGLKLVVGRARPDAAPGDPDEFQPFGRLDSSFPSGHTTVAFAAAAAIDAESEARWVSWVVYPAAAAVGWARVREDQHWLSDVAAGAALGFWTGRKVDQIERGQVRLFDRARFLFRGSPRKFQVGFKTRF
jgi:membrane-associated phospholipid phosphatase